MRSFKREERIKQLKSCGQSIIDNAEKIVSDVRYPLNTKIIIDMKANEMPIIAYERSFIPESLLER